MVFADVIIHSEDHVLAFHFPSLWQSAWYGIRVPWIWVDEQMPFVRYEKGRFHME